MNILVTGASGFLGEAVAKGLLKRGNVVFGLYRKQPDDTPHLCITVRENTEIDHYLYSVLPLLGDITKPNLGIHETIPHFDAVYHCAAIVDLGAGKLKELWHTNVEGTANVLKFCEKHAVPHLYYVSTAYLKGRNYYERTKIHTEWLVERESKRQGMELTIFRPSIIVADSDGLTAGLGAFYQLSRLILKFHRRADKVRRRAESALQLNPIEIPLTMRGNPEGHLNLIPRDAVVDFITNTTARGTFNITNPNPPTLREIVDWVGEALMLKLTIAQEFDASPVDTLFNKMAKPFLPYLQGEYVASDLKECPPVDRDFVVKTVLKSLGEHKEGAR